MGAMLDAVMFPMPRPPGYVHEEGVSTYLVTADGRRIAYCVATSLQQRHEPIAILYAHGNAEDLSSVSYDIKGYAKDLHATIYAMDYAGYGLSEGKPSEANTYRDVEAMLALMETKFSRKHIFLWGRSLGSGPICYLAHKAARRDQQPFAGVILLSPFLSAFRVVMPQAILKRSLPVDKFTNLERLRDGFDTHVFVMHGKNDEVISCIHGEILADTIPPQFRHPPIFVNRAGHNDMEERIRQQTRKSLSSHVKDFIDRVVGL